MNNDSDSDRDSDRDSTSDSDSAGRSTRFGVYHGDDDGASDIDNKASDASM